MIHVDPDLDLDLDLGLGLGVEVGVGVGCYVDPPRHVAGQQQKPSEEALCRAPQM